MTVAHPPLMEPSPEPFSDGTGHGLLWPGLLYCPDLTYFLSLHLCLQVLLDCSQQLMSLGAGSVAQMQQKEQQGVSSLLSAPSSPFPHPKLARGTSPRLPEEEHAGVTALTATSLSGADPLGPSSLSVGEPPLVQLYKRAATVEEATARSQEHCLALDGRMRVGEVSLRLATLALHATHLWKDKGGKGVPAPRSACTPLVPLFPSFIAALVPAFRSQACAFHPLGANLCRMPKKLSPSSST